MSQTSTILTARADTNEILDYLTTSAECWDVLCGQLATISISEEATLERVRETPLRWRTAPLLPLLVAEDGDTLDVNEVQGICEELNRICTEKLGEGLGEGERRVFSRLAALMSCAARRGGLVYVRR